MFPDLLSAAYIVRRGGVARRYAEGLALLPGARWARFSPHQPFRVASVSKLIAAFAIMRLVARGAVALDTDIGAYLAGPVRHPAFRDHALTLRMLLSHTSGLRNGADFPLPFNQYLRSRLAQAAAEPDYAGWFSNDGDPPGVGFSYSDTNFALAAEIAECVSGLRFDHFMAQELFAPLGLDIGYNWSGVSERARRRAAAACRWIDGAWRAQVDAAPPPAPEIALFRAPGNEGATIAEYRLGANGFAFAPQGGLRASLNDMDVLASLFMAAHEVTALMGAPEWVFDPQTQNGDTENGFYQAYGLGMQIPLGRGGDRFFGADSSDWRGHCGDAYGWLTGLWWNARTDTTLVYAVNGVGEADRPPSAASALTVYEQALIDRALAHA